MSLNIVQNLVRRDLLDIDCVLKRVMFSRVAYINDIVFYMEKKSGKKVRPLVLILTARALGYTGVQHIYFSVILELLHMATLLHDDVVDGDVYRRSKLVTNSFFDNQTAILFGDFVYSRAFQLMVNTKNQAALYILSNATNTLTEGELLQHSNISNINITKIQYMYTIECKTSVLFSAAAEIGAILGNCSAGDQSVLKSYGVTLGLIYQLVDDVLDYTSSKIFLGKNFGSDFFSGKITLPLLFVFERYPAVRRVVLASLTGDYVMRYYIFKKISSIMRETNSIERVILLIDSLALKSSSLVSGLVLRGVFQDMLFVTSIRMLPRTFMYKIRNGRDLNPRPSA